MANADQDVIISIVSDEVEYITTALGYMYSGQSGYSGTSGISGYSGASGVSEGPDGWTTIGGEWTYATANSFTTATDQSANIAKGDIIKLTDGTVKYFYVTSVSGTTVTIYAGSDYILSGGAITNGYISKDISPAGFPQWFAYTATVTSNGGGTAPTFATVQDRFHIVGKTVYVKLFKRNTTGGTPGDGGNGVLLALPVSATTSNWTATATGVATTMGEAVWLNNASWNTSAIAYFGATNALLWTPGGNITTPSCASFNNAVRQITGYFSYEMA